MPGKCTHPDCPKQASYGFKVTGKVETCAPHKEPGMVPLTIPKRKLCAYDGCDKRDPKFGALGDEVPTLCGAHKDELPGPLSFNVPCGAALAAGGKCGSKKRFGRDSELLACPKHATSDMLQLIGRPIAPQSTAAAPAAAAAASTANSDSEDEEDPYWAPRSEMMEQGFTFPIGWWFDEEEVRKSLIFV